MGRNGSGEYPPTVTYSPTYHTFLCIPEDVAHLVLGSTDTDFTWQGLSANVRSQPEWIQKGCGDAPYNCPEKAATWAVDGETPDVMPDLSKHSNFMAEFLVKHPEVETRLGPGQTPEREGLALGVAPRSALNCLKTRHERRLT